MLAPTTNAGTTNAGDTTSGSSGTTQNQGNFFDRILPTAGSILGGIGGGILGGLAAPFTGGVINPIDAGIAGASGGDVLGRMGQNELTHQNVKNDLGSSALSGAVGQAGGSLLGGIGTKVLGKVISPLASHFTADAVMKQAPGLIDRPTAQYLIDNGITNLSKVTDVAPKVVGQATGQATGEVDSGPAFTNAIQSAVENSTDKINITKALQQVSDVAGKSIVKPSTQNTIGNALQKSIENMTQKSGGDISKIPQFSASGKSLDKFMTVFNDSGQMKNMTRGGAYDEAKQFLGAASQIAAKAPKDQFGNIADTQQATLVNTFNTWGHALESHALGLGDSDVDLPISDEAKQSMQAGIADLEKTNPKLYNTLSKNINDAATYKDIKSDTAPLVKASKAANAMSGKMNSVPSTTPLEAGTGGKMNLIHSLVSSPTAKKVEAFGLNKIGNATSTGSNPGGVLLKALGVKNVDASLLNKVIPMAARSTALATANGPEEVPTNGVQSEAGTGTQGSQGAYMQPNTSAGVPNADQVLWNALMNQMNNGGGISGNALSTAQALAPVVTKQQLVAPTLDTLLQTSQNAGGPQGLLQGMYSKLTGLIGGTPANTFNTQSGALAAQLASIYGITPEQAASLIPQLTQTQGTAAPQTQGLQTLLGSLGGTAPIASAAPAQ